MKVAKTPEQKLDANNLASKRYRLRNPEKIRAKSYREKYGISLETLNHMILNQNGLCGICGRLPGKKGLNVDHDHKTGKLRELLCGKCNIALGCFDDSAAIVQAAVNYLKKHS